MPPSPLAALLALLLLGTASAAWAQPSPCQTGNRRIPLKEGPAPLAELCVSPGQATLLLFDRSLAGSRLELESQARFERVETTDKSLILVPSGKLLLGERLRLTVRFAEGESPLSATFVLVVRPEAERQVEVVRPPRSAEACQAELARKEEELRGCQGAPALHPRSGLARLLAQHTLGDSTIPKRALQSEPPVLSPKAALEAFGLTLHFINFRRVVEVPLKNTEASKPWRVGGGRLTSASGKELELLDAVQRAPIAPGKKLSVWVELDVPPESAAESYTLQLWDEDKARAVTLPGLNLR